jgi:2-oxoglutarate/2-oxoacid ferredoxin oxidoreductase subunit alpha
MSTGSKGANKRILMKGNEAIGEGAVLAGCDAYFGYPITPQTELLEHMSKRMIEEGRIFLQAESEIGAIYMCFGVAVSGLRPMTSSSGPGAALKQEGLSYLAAAELPTVMVDVMRCGPGLAGIAPAQADYFMFTRPGHGDYHNIVLAPASVQEAMDLTMLAFELADKYRNPAVVLADGVIGLITEPVEVREPVTSRPDKPWAMKGCRGRERRILKTVNLVPEELQEHNRHLQEKYARIRAAEVRYASYRLDDAEIGIVAYGSSARVAQTAVNAARAEGFKVGLLRPISLFPFPTEAVAQLSEKVSFILAVEMSAGQMVEDVRLAVNGRVPVHLLSRMGGVVPAPEEVLEELKRIASAATIA